MINGWMMMVVMDDEWMMMMMDDEWMDDD